jgi:hypothetical protein
MLVYYWFLQQSLEIAPIIQIEGVCGQGAEENIWIQQSQKQGEILRSEIHKLINSIWNNEELPYQCNESIYCTNLQERR